MRESIQIVGTSKSKDDNAYYISSREKFWGLIEKSKIGKRYEPIDFNHFTNDTGVGFCELVFNKNVSKDLELKENLALVLEGIKDFLSFMNSPNKPDIIAFNGKTAAGWFFQYIDTGKIDKRPAKYLNKIFGEFSFGLSSRHYNGIKVYILPSTSGAAAATWDETPWLDFWNSI